MPTVLVISGWRLFFYSNEGNEPIHIHAEKAEMECKFWLKREGFEIDEAFSYNLSPAAKREIRKIIFEHFDYIVDEWDKYFERR
ncbi:MAG: DUF4160 domain-containing protein [Bacteroidota bacterium]